MKNGDDVKKSNVKKYEDNKVMQKKKLNWAMRPS